jgi:tetratricopeptide (TPR) repeat protein
VTIVPPSAEAVLSPLRATIDDLARELTAIETDAAQGVALKQRIFLLHRSVEQYADVIESLQSDVRALVESWKGRFAANAVYSITPQNAGSVPPPTPTASVSNVSGPVAAVVASATPSSSGVRVETPSAALRMNLAPPVAGQPRVIDELNASTFVERGWSRIASGDFTGAETSLEQALALNPGDAYAETLLAWALMSQANFEAAMALLRDVLERVPDFALALINVGFVHLRRGEYDLALDHLDRAIALDSDRKATLYAFYYRGLVHFEMQRHDDAISDLNHAIELGPNLIEARFELGRVYWFANRTDDAIVAWRTGAEVNKFNPWSARCREMLATVADGGAPSRVA